MTSIAIIHAFWLLLLPIGLICAAVGSFQRRRFCVTAGRLLAALSLPAVVFCTQMWPFDFLISRTEMRVPVAAGAYTVTLVQKPGIDFYDTFFEVRRADGKITQVMIDADDSKWWRPRVIMQGRYTYFVRGLEGITAKTSFVDPGDGTVFSGDFGLTYDLERLDFDEAWAKLKAIQP